MRKNLYTLKEDVKKFDKELLWCITFVEGYQQSCCGDKTWIWNAKAWQRARLRLEICEKTWTKKSKGVDKEFSWWPRLRDSCKQCVRDMERYKQLCERSSTRNDKTYYAGFRRYKGGVCMRHVDGGECGQVK
jgi:hypothetical protein